MAEPYKSTPASRVFGMGLPRRSNLPPATFFGTPIAEERRFLSPRLRQNALAEQELEAKESALAAQQAKQEMELQGQEAMGRAFADLEQGEDIENIFRKNPAIVFSPQFEQLSRATEFVQPSKAVKSLVPNLAKGLPPEFRTEFMAKASNLKNADEVFNAYTDVELKKSMAEQRGRLGELGVDVSQLKPDYLYTPQEEAGFKTKAALARQAAERDLERQKASESALDQAKQWALKRGAQANLVNMLDNPSAIYQLGASIGGSRNEAASRQMIDRQSRLFSIAKDDLDRAMRDLNASEKDFADEEVINAKKKIFDEAQARYNQAKSDFEGVLIEPPVEEAGLPGMQLPDYDVYSPEYRQAFEAVTGVPSAARVPSVRMPTVSPAAQRAATTAEDITSPAATGGAPAAPFKPVAPAQTTSKGKEEKPSVGLSPEALLRIQNAPVTELQKTIEKEERLAGEEGKINEEWTKAKSDIEGKLKTLYPDKPNKYGINPLELFALQVLGAKTVVDPEITLAGGAPVPGGFVSPEIPIQVKVLRDLGIKPSDTAFTESGKKRLSLLGLIGSQDVTYNALIQDWADKFLKSRNLIPKTLEEEITLKPEDPDKIERKMKEIIDASEKP